MGRESWRIDFSSVPILFCLEFEKKLFFFEEWFKGNSLGDEISCFLFEAREPFNVFLIEDTREYCVTVFTNNDFTETFAVDREFERVVVDAGVDETHWLVHDAILIFSD